MLRRVISVLVLLSVFSTLVGCEKEESTEKESPSKGIVDNEKVATASNEVASVTTVPSELPREEVSKPRITDVPKNEKVYPQRKTVIVNIANTDGTRFLKVMYDIAYDSDKYPQFDKKVETYSKVIKNKSIEYLSALTLKELLDKSAQLNIRKDLKREFNLLLDEVGIACSNVYVTDYIIQ